MLAVDWSALKRDWFLPCAFAQADLTRVAWRLRQGEVWLPTLTGHAEITLCPLDELGKLGPDRRDIMDGFRDVDSVTAFPTFWGHDADAIRSMRQVPNRWLQPLMEARKGRRLHRPSKLWVNAGKVLLAERMWLKTQKLVALQLDSKVLSNVWYEFSWHEPVDCEHTEKTLVLWLNSTLGLLTLLVARDETRGAWVQFKKTHLKAMPVLDIRKLDDGQLTQLAAAYDDLCERELQPLPRMAQDETRAAIDNALSEVLGLPDLAPLREMLAREPVVSMQRL